MARLLPSPAAAGGATGRAGRDRGGRERHGRQRSAGGIKSVGKVLDILEHLADARRPVGASEVARALDFHVSTAHRLLQTLAARGYVEQHDSLRSYVLGPRLLALSGGYGGASLGQIARAELERLRDALGETVHLAVYRDGDVIEVASAHGHQPVSAMLGASFRDPAHCSALGKVLLAHLAPDALAEFFARGPLERRTPRSITRKPDLLRALDAIRRHGFALDEEELASDLCCVAVPIADGASRVVAALSVAMPKSRFRTERVPQWRSALAAAASRIGAQLHRVHG
ncbi:MAG TPA: IclR family transcriptional regulator [Burkholderiaceae bacterium]|nr:IclR family transcriptional regulator [Burkholderiaceae bacterium]